MIIPIFIFSPSGKYNGPDLDPTPFYIFILILVLTFLGVLIGFHFGMNSITGTKIIFGVGIAEIIIMTIWTLLS